MSTLSCSPSSSSSYRPTSPLSRPTSPLSGSYSRSTSPHTHQHTNKSRSISSIPTYHSIHRLTQTQTLPDSQAGPSNLDLNSGGTLSRSSSLKHHPRPVSPRKQMTSSSSTLSRSSSVRSCRSRKMTSASTSASGAQSPSRLPSIDCVSYFPPFEDMGSNEGCPSSSSSSVERDNSARPAGDEPIRASLNRRTSHHKKGKSLSSIAGIMSASLSWSLSGLACTSPTASTGINGTGNGNDDKAVEALTKRFSSSSSTSKRRVLEPFTLTPMDTAQDAGDRGSKMHKRRMRSEVEVDISLIRSNSLQEGMHRREGVRRSRDEDVDVVDKLLAETPSRPQSTTRRTRPNLRLPIPTLPNWRFPLGPSPPVTCLSPDIPLEAFSTAIENPCLLSPSRLTFLPTTDGDEVEAIDCGLSPSPTSPCSFGNGPSTPPKDPVNTDDKVSIDHSDNSKLSPWSAQGKDLDLRRMESRTSELSIETIKQPQWLDVTPKPSKIVKRGIN
ncbi:hypothetical protein I302_100812 [Kwoniella bestiolae CBS 10118]|uniref:Uncharacterized protein n=1 Tax=Kwoniella bestiolae CBS 10118 TaxID=1296100 RepID=A0A1B9G638_9TREE|nr:hypothetical protein I302_04185 [Kwoniella bestiolae CBS 10118]OCF26499.1 hypothetical protein I302_04185 [Kwoniella bestiolae CBS 10118]